MPHKNVIVECRRFGQLALRNAWRRCVLALLAWLAAGMASPACLAQSPASQPPRTIELLVLGSGGPRAEGRASSSNLLLIDGKPRILVDVGPGAFVRSGELKLNLDDLDLVFFTHFHIDHSADFPAIAKTRAQRRAGAITFNVFGPLGNPGHPSATRFIEKLFGPGGAFEYQPTFGSPEKFVIRDLPAGLAAGLAVIHAQDGLTVTTIGTSHGPTPSVAYRFDYGGCSIVFSGDTNETAADNLVTLAKGADLLVFNCAILDGGGSTLQSNIRHTAPRRIGEIAQRAGVKRLLLSHIQPIVDRAKDEVYRSVSAGYAGPVRFAEDKMRYDWNAR